MNFCQATINRLYCNACEVYLGSKANYALHVLTKEHCENLIKVGKPKSEHKSIVNEETSSNIELSKATLVTVKHTKSTPTSADGCCIGGQLCKNEGVKESDYVKYLESLAENSFNGKVVSVPEIINSNATTVPPFCKTITKSLISCEVCNVILTKIPDYESHIKSHQHIWNMKLRGMGATANVIKGSTDSNTTNALEVSTNNHQVQNNDLGQLTPTCESVAVIPFPLLYCDACELLLNTPRQFINHVNAGSHKLCVKKKGKMKVKKVQFPVLNKHYCYSCQLVLNSSQQFNEHKTGRKHKIRCSQLIASGITIPPEEQSPQWNLPKTSPDKPTHYPEFYERFILRKQGEDLQKTSNFKELLMNENGCESNDCIKTLDATTPTNISEGVQNLDSFPHHIYRIQNKNLNTYSELPFTLLASNYYFRNS